MYSTAECTYFSLSPYEGQLIGRVEIDIFLGVSYNFLPQNTTLFVYA